MKISKEFTFNSAHHLPNYIGKCSNIHGHTYRLIVTFEGEIDQVSGMVVDFGKLKKFVQENTIDILDHEDLNTILYNPTAENLIVWIYDELNKWVAPPYKLYKLELWETPTSHVEYP